MTTPTLYTLGHSNRTLDEFFAIVRQNNVQQLLDVRRHPQSRRNPSFDQAALKLASEDEKIAYCWLGSQLGGMRRDKGDSHHSALGAGFRGYADHMEGKYFQDGIEKLTQLASNTPTAIFCAEREPYQCHRSLIADFLTQRGWRVVHLINLHQQQPHQLNPLARTQEGILIYDRIDQEQLDLGI